MRTLVIAPLFCLIVAGVGWLVCRLAGWSVYPKDLMIAGVVAVIASFAGAVPLILARGSDQIAASQAGLVATMAHLMIGIALAAVMILKLKAGLPFTYWLLAFYGSTLIVVAVESIRLVKAAPAAPARAAPKQ